MQLDMGNQIVQVGDFLVELDALRIVERIKEYDTNLEVLCLDPARAESITEEPFIIAEHCKDGKLRPVLRAWKLDEHVLLRIIAADKCTLQTLESMEQATRDEAHSRYRDAMEESHDIAQHVLKDRKSSYTVRDSVTGDMLTFYDDRPTTRK